MLEKYLPNLFLYEIFAKIFVQAGIYFLYFSTKILFSIFFLGGFELIKFFLLGFDLACFFTGAQ